MKVICGVYEKGKPHGVVLGEIDLSGPDRSATTHPTYATDWLPGIGGFVSKGFDGYPFRCRKHGEVIAHQSDQRTEAFIAHQMNTDCPA